MEPTKPCFYRVSDIVGDPKNGIPGLIPIGRSTWWAWVKQGRVKKPIKWGPRTSAWEAEYIHTLIESLKG
ncbi:MAG TPA: AlpA family transcriptional regulator [Candidatus Ozemobacteraceae bacterium]|nr:AlpA family transcriptional regulator [Candidatus Ozemobacteraceae bacterium]